MIKRLRQIRVALLKLEYHTSNILCLRPKERRKIFTLRTRSRSLFGGTSVCNGVIVALETAMAACMISLNEIELGRPSYSLALPEQKITSTSTCLIIHQKKKISLQAVNSESAWSMIPPVQRTSSNKMHQITNFLTVWFIILSSKQIPEERLHASLCKGSLEFFWM